MKSKKSSLRAALFLALISAAFVFTACWQGTPAGGSGVPGSLGTVKPGGNNSGGGIKSGDTDSKDSGGGSGGGNTTASSIEGITWKAEVAGSAITLLLKDGNAQLTSTAAGQTVSDSGKYTINGDTIKFTSFTSGGLLLFTKEFKYKVEGDTFTMESSDGLFTYVFKKA